MEVSFREGQVVLAAVAHPDDIEFCFAGTLLLLKEAGCSIHMWNLANGCCGSMVHGREEIAAIRWHEAQSSADLAGAVAHAPLFNDLEVFYDQPSLARVSSVMRRIRPSIVLTHSPLDYMEDHQNVCRLVQTSAFTLGMPNYETNPPEHPVTNTAVRMYHAAPHGLHDGLERPFQPDYLVDIGSVLERKRAMLACHASQQSWLDASQGMNAYLLEMESMGREMAARKAGGPTVAEGWKRHSHLGYCGRDFDPLPVLLGPLCQTFNT